MDFYEEDAEPNTDRSGMRTRGWKKVTGLVLEQNECTSHFMLCLDNDLFEHAMRTIKPEGKEKFIRNKSFHNLIVSTKHLQTMRM